MRLGVGRDHLFGQYLSPYKAQRDKEAYRAGRMHILRLANEAAPSSSAKSVTSHATKEEDDLVQALQGVLPGASRNGEGTGSVLVVNTAMSS